jgi:hypothetical protein
MDPFLDIPIPEPFAPIEGSETEQFADPRTDVDRFQRTVRSVTEAVHDLIEIFQIGRSGFLPDLFFAPFAVPLVVFFDISGEKKFFPSDVKRMEGQISFLLPSFDRKGTGPIISVFENESSGLLPTLPGRKDLVEGSIPELLRGWTEGILRRAVQIVDTTLIPFDQ